MNEDQVYKYISITIIVVAFILSMFFLFKDRAFIDTKTKNFDYEAVLFDDSYVHTVNVVIKDEDWNDLLQNPTLKTKYRVTVEIDKKKIENVSFNTKGNSSLNQVASGPPTQRFSYKINFGKYVSEQTFHGLDKLHLNNMYADATCIKDYMSYKMFQEMGIPAPLTSYTILKVNGKTVGLYLMVEEMGESFLQRNELDGKMYKPEQNQGEHGASLKYKGESIDSYSDIFDNNVTKAIDDDKIRLIKSIKQLNNQENLENILDIDELIDFYAVHNFLLSYDSYTGPSIHNYYLYEKDGKMSMFPWDYNMNYGSFGMGQEDNIIANYGIDTPLIGIDNSERPLWNWIVSNEEYRNKYYEAMDVLLKEYLESGKFEKEMNQMYEIFKPYLSEQVYSFYQPNQVDSGYQMLLKFTNLRTQSIRKQLNGELSKITDEQIDEARVDCSSLDITVMGLKTGFHETHQGEREEPTHGESNEEDGKRRPKKEE